MYCAYCGNAYHTDAIRCEGCGSPRSARIQPNDRSADALYAKVGHALITGEPNKSRAMLEKILGSPQKDPKTLWTERGAKIALCLGILYYFPMVFAVLAMMVMPFVITIYLPYLGLKTLLGWIAGDTARR